MNISVQTCYDLQYLTMQSNEYINDPTEPACLALRHGMEYLMHPSYKHIMYPIKKYFKVNEIPQQRFF